MGLSFLRFPSSANRRLPYIQENPTLAGLTMVPARLRRPTATTSLRSGIPARSRSLLALARNSSLSRPNPSIHPTTSARTDAPECTPSPPMMVTIRLPHRSRWTLRPPAHPPHHQGMMSIRLTTPSRRAVPPPPDSPVAAYRTPQSLPKCLPSPELCTALTDSSIALPTTTPRVVSSLIA
jgi:hypothetical protein